MNTSEILIYQNSEGCIKLDVRLDEETVWLTQDQMAALFGKARTTITKHIQKRFQRRRTKRRSGMSEFPTNHSTWRY